MFLNCQLAGTVMGFPDVLLLPAPPSPSLMPTPFLNSAMRAASPPTQTLVTIAAGPMQTLLAKIPVTTGGAGGPGIASGTMMSLCQSTGASTLVFILGMPVTRMVDMCLSNLTNLPSANICPSQSLVMALA